MTYQTPTQTHDYDTAEEASSLLTSVTGSKKKNGVPTIQAMIGTCLLLGTISVIYYGGSDSSNSTFHHAADTSEAFLLRHNQAAPGVYDPKQDFCFKDTDNAGKYCWYPEDKSPYGNWVGDGGHGYSDCGLKCTDDASGEMPCVPAGGSFHGLSETVSCFGYCGKDRPFQTCYKYFNTAKTCWTNSYYLEGIGSGWYECVPDGGGWNSIDSKLPLNYCDTPCQELHHEF